MISLSEALQVAAVTALIHMTLYYGLSLKRRDTSVVDIGWGLGFVLIAWTLMSVVIGEAFGFTLLVLLISVWGLRLGIHILQRKGDSGEDWRYQNMRAQSPNNWWWLSYPKVFLGQGVLMLVIASPLILAASKAQEFEASWNVWLGAAVWTTGFIFESVGDYQLSQFIKEKKSRKNPKKGDQIMTSGLWAYTRHPNYFGEVTIWWGIYLMVIGLSGAWWTIISPLTITFLLLKVSGITMLEKKYVGNKEFKAYKARTSAFFPRQPKPEPKKTKKSNKSKSKKKKK